MDGFPAAQYYLDFRTGSQTAVNGSVFCAEQRSACTALNRVRARGILEADKLSAQSQSLPAHVWEARFARLASDWQLPLVSLERFGINHDTDGIPMAAPDLSPLKTGAEASPYEDRSNGVVYKLFDLRADGSLGKKLSIAITGDGELELGHQPALLQDTVEKLMLLNDIGAHPTEIVGLTDDGHYLLAKQPRANPSGNFLEDRTAACRLIKGVPAKGPGLRTTAYVVWLDHQAWLVGDLHERNIMRDGDGHPTIIDALVAPLPPTVLRGCRWLQHAAEDAEALRLDLPLPERRLFDDVDDSEL